MACDPNYFGKIAHVLMHILVNMIYSTLFSIFSFVLLQKLFVLVRILVSLADHTPFISGVNIKKYKFKFSKINIEDNGAEDTPFCLRFQHNKR